jgi:hypothetical protein
VFEGYPRRLIGRAFCADVPGETQMSSTNKASIAIDVVVAQLIEHLPAEAGSAKHEALSGSAHKLRAVIKACGSALVELENAVLWNYDNRLLPGTWLTPKGAQDLTAEAQKHFEPLVTACIDLIRTETELINGLGSLPFVLGMFETKRLSVLASVRIQLAGGLIPPPPALKELTTAHL